MKAPSTFDSNTQLHKYLWSHRKSTKPHLPKHTQLHPKHHMVLLKLHSFVQAQVPMEWNHITPYQGRNYRGGMGMGAQLQSVEPPFCFLENKLAANCSTSSGHFGWSYSYQWVLDGVKWGEMDLKEEQEGERSGWIGLFTAKKRPERAIRTEIQAS